LAEDRGVVLVLSEAAEMDLKITSLVKKGDDVI